MSTEPRDGHVTNLYGESEATNRYDGAQVADPFEAAEAAGRHGGAQATKVHEGPPVTDLQGHVERAASGGRLVVQPRMGMSDPRQMAAGLRDVAAADATTVGTITIDSYTRVEDVDGAGAALAAGKSLNGFPIVNHGPRLTAQVAAAANPVPVQVRHGSARPGHIFTAMLAAGLAASEGGPVSYCLPYSRLPLAESVPAWTQAVRELAEGAHAQGLRAHLETFGGCMLGQMCPPSLLVAISVLEARFFAAHGLSSVSLSYAQQTNAVQDIEALAALRRLAHEYLRPDVAWHVVLYTYMGVYPSLEAGAALLLDASARIAVRGGAERLIVKTVAEAHRIPTVAENITALERAARVGEQARTSSGAADLPWAAQVDYEQVYTEARTLIEAVLALAADPGVALRRAFAAGVLDVPFCLHRDNAGLAQGAIDDQGRLYWGRVGAMPLPRPLAATKAITSGALLGMLRYTADVHDRAARLAGTGRAPDDVEAGRTGGAEGRPGGAGAGGGREPYRLVIVGSGPRGLAVAERLAARLAEHPPGRDVEISLVDKVEVGAGRIWRTDQDPHLLMNTACGEVTMFSGPPDGVARAGGGPSLAQWWESVDAAYPGPDGYAPRGLYGRYLRFFLEAIRSSLPARVRLDTVTAEVTGVERAGDGWRLRLAGGASLPASRVVLATGHPVPELSDDQAALAAFAAAQKAAGKEAAGPEAAGRPRARYIRGDSAADMPLDEIAAGAKVAVVGMGLSFYDVMALLTLGRGGRFDDDGDGGLRYVPSGREPVLVAGSRSGVPVLARGHNQKGPEWRYQARLFTPQRVARLRSRGPLDFMTDVWPWIDAEAQLVYYGTAVRARYGREVEQAFLDRVVGEAEPDRPETVGSAGRASAERFGLDDLALLDIPALGRPFRDRRFAGVGDYTAALSALIRGDVAEARRGNLHGPVKAALDVLRDVRGTIRRAVDHAGLTADSHRDAFLGWFVPLTSLLVTGPPLERLQQVLALLEARILEVVGPQARYAPAPAGGRFEVWSPRVAGSRRHCDVLIDARIPGPDLRRDPAALTRDLRARGLWTLWTNSCASGRLATGGIAVTGPPGRPVDVAGDPVEGLYVLGIPTEGQRWFTQVGSARPGPWTDFTAEADAIAADALAPVTAPVLEGATR